MAPLPLLLLVVDGVLNPAAAPPAPDGYRAYAFLPEDDPPVRLRAAHGPWLLLPPDPARGLTADMVAELHTWRAAL